MGTLSTTLICQAKLKPLWAPTWHFLFFSPFQWLALFVCFVFALGKIQHCIRYREKKKWITGQEEQRTESLTWRRMSVPCYPLDECLPTCHIRTDIRLQFPWCQASCRLPAIPIYSLCVVTLLDAAWNISRVTSLQGTCFINMIYRDVKNAAGWKGRERTGLGEGRRKTETEGVRKTSRRFVMEMTRLWGGDEYKTGVMRRLI